jgi:hypothetical protein
MGYRNYGPANGFVVSQDGTGDFKTISSALSAVTSSTTIFIKPGEYTENLTGVTDVNLTAFDCDAYTPNVIINGNLTFSGDGVISLSGIELRTNNNYCLSVTGSTTTVVRLFSCNLIALNHTAIDFSSSSSSSEILMTNCTGDISTTGIAFFSQSSAGSFLLEYSHVSNSGGSSTASTISAGIFSSSKNILDFPVTTSGTSYLESFHDRWTTQNENVTTFTIGGSGGTSVISHGVFFSGTASSIAINDPSTATIYNSSVTSTNAHAITGTGTVNYSGLSIPSGDINTSTINKLNFYAGTVL